MILPSFHHCRDQKCAETPACVVGLDPDTRGQGLQLWGEPSLAHDRIGHATHGKGHSDRHGRGQAHSPVALDDAEPPQPCTDGVAKRPGPKDIVALPW